MLKITEEQKEKAIDIYAQTGNMTEAAKAVGLSRRTLEREKQRSRTFKELMTNAKAIYCDSLETILDNRIRSAEYDRDKASALLLMFKMKAEMPDKYRERIDHKVESNIKIITGVPRPTKKSNGGATP